MKKSLIIFGAGGLGREIKTLVDTLPEWQLMGFCDDSISAGEKIMGVPVLGGVNYLINQTNEMNVVVAIGNPVVKAGVVEKLTTSAFLRFPSLIHPRAILGDTNAIQIEAGTIIAAGCILTTSIHIGKHVLLNLNCTIGHDSVIGDFTSIMPGVNLAGHVSLGKRVLLGSGVNVLNKIQIGDDTIVGSGSVVIRNISPGTTAVGVPAKAIKSNGK